MCACPTTRCQASWVWPKQNRSSASSLARRAKTRDGRAAHRYSVCLYGARVEEEDRSPGDRDPHRLRQLAEPGLVLLGQRFGGPSHRGVAGRLGLAGGPGRPRSGRDPSRPPRPSCPGPSAPRGGAARPPPRSGAVRVRPRRRRSRSRRHRCGRRRRCTARNAGRLAWMSPITAIRMAAILGPPPRRGQSPARVR